jgi:SAM-dependent methyltransferase
MGVKLERKKPRSWLASVAHRANKWLPKNLDLMLDMAMVTNRLAFENADGANLYGENRFLAKHIKPADRVLEIGCSAGRVLSQVKAAERVGVDYDRAAIERGRNDHPAITLIHADAKDYLSTAGHFDVLILSHVLEHIDQPEDFLKSLKADRIYVEVPDFDTDVLNQVRAARKRSLIYTDADHVAEYDRDELEALFDRSGLRVIDSEFRWGVMRYWVVER